MPLDSDRKSSGERSDANQVPHLHVAAFMALLPCAYTFCAPAPLCVMCPIDLRPSTHESHPFPSPLRCSTC